MSMPSPMDTGPRPPGPRSPVVEVQNWGPSGPRPHRRQSLADAGRTASLKNRGGYFYPHSPGDDFGAQDTVCRAIVSYPRA